MKMAKSRPLALRTDYPVPEGHTNTSDHEPNTDHQKKELRCELVPKTCWFSNVRDHLKQSEWDKVKDWCYRRAGYHCEICGLNGKLQGRRHRVEAHEIWDYNDTERIQTLVGLISLCPMCHKSKHYGRAISIGEDKSVRFHLKQINAHWHWRDVFKHCRDSITLWQERSYHNYTLNMDYLRDEFGLEVVIHRKPIELTDEDLAHIKAMDDYKNL